MPNSNVSRDPHDILCSRAVNDSSTKCEPRINTYKPNPFTVKDKQNNWNNNNLILRDPRLRILSGVAPLDRGLIESSTIESSLHQKPCFGHLNIQYYSNGHRVPKAGYPHS